MEIAGFGRDDRWPADMVITIEDHATQLWELLWVREALGLLSQGDVPPPLVDGPEPSPPWSVREQAQAWSQLWHDALHNTAHVIDRPQFERVATLTPGSPERADALQRLRGPSWRDRFGDDDFDERFDAWNARRFEQLASSMRRSLDEHPERRSVDALARAWRAGLRKVVTLPCVGEHTRTIGPEALLVTECTREDPARYDAALGAFRPEGGLRS